MAILSVSMAVNVYDGLAKQRRLRLAINYLGKYRRIFGGSTVPCCETWAILWEIHTSFSIYGINSVENTCENKSNQPIAQTP